MKIEPVKKDFYLNPVARLYLQATQLIRVLIAGRGFGKSFINGISILLKVLYLPRSKGMFLGATYTQILTNTLMPMKSAWEWFGYMEDVHYVVGKQPPSWYKKPYHQPKRFENVITWWNGTTVMLGSFDRPQLLRGGSNDWVICDEALLIKKDVYDQIVIPSLRGTHPRLKGKKGHLSEEFTSSMPYGTLGQWLLEKEAEAKNPENDTFYIEGTSWHNRKVLGDDVIKRWYRTMSRIKYLVEVMNKRMVIGSSLFYPQLRSRHWYTESYNYEYIDRLGFDLDTSKKDSRWDNDCDPDMALHVSHDFGAFNSITIDQYYRSVHEVRFINVMYAEHPRIIDDLANEFCKYYQHHRKKEVYQWGDKSGRRKEGNAKLSYFDQFASILRRNGWRVFRQKTGDIEHLDRHNFINRIHREDEYPKLPRIRHNLNNCKDLRIALESAQMKADKKDKSSERNASIKQQHATHLTDAYDYRIYHAFYNKHSEMAQGYEIRIGA